MQILIAIGLAAAVAVPSYYLRLLTLSGAAATFILAAVIYGVGGWEWTIPILAFFILSSLLSKAGRKHKADFEQLHEKGSTRDAAQVLANGGVGGLCALFMLAYPSDFWYAAYLGSIAAVTADTWSTETGALSHQAPRHILTFKRVPPGTSGGITLLGTVGGAAGALGIGIIGTAFWPGTEDLVHIMGIVLAAGIAGNVFDSILGASLQTRYTCAVCGVTTERRIHHDLETNHTGGVAWINNDAVNALASLFGACAAALLLYAL
ncbi:MAG: hypothetical protein CL946_05390 [Ectothiorhodospiraceae bacterium]|nr:hypothetical protein [Ectothiorhodospiraceae bacterium]